MSKYEAFVQYQEYGFMNLQTGDKTNFTGKEYRELQESFSEEFKEFDVLKDIQNRIMNYGKFRIVKCSVFGEVGYDYNENTGEYKEILKRVRFIVEM